MKPTPPVLTTGTRQDVGRRRRDQTRRRLLTAADELFREQGYNATTVTAIAERAEMSLQTLYLAWGSKSGLFRAAADAAATASGLPLSPVEWRDVIRHELTSEAGTTPDAQDYLAAVAGVFVRVAERSAAYWQMQPAAAAADPEVALGHRLMMQQRRTTMAHVAAAMPSAGLRSGLTPADVEDTLWSLASPEMYALFTVQAGRTPDQFRRWLTSTLLAVLTEPASGPAPAERTKPAE